MWIAIVLGTLIVRHEVNLLSAKVIDDSGYSWPLDVLFGPGDASLHAAGWLAALTEDRNIDGFYSRTLVIYVVLDCLFIFLYTSALLHHVRHRVTARSGRWILCVAIAIFAFLDAAEGVIAILISLSQASPRTGRILAAVVSLITNLKWFALAGLCAAWFLNWILSVGSSGADDYSRRRRRRQLVLLTLYQQRYSLLFFIPFAVLAALSGHPVLEQLPDAERDWIHGWDGLRACSFAITATLTLAVIMFLFGRVRSDIGVKDADEAEEMMTRRPHRLIWIIAPVYVLTSCLIWYTVTENPPIIWGRLLISVLIPTSILLVSTALRLLSRRNPSLRRALSVPPLTLRVGIG